MDAVNIKNSIHWVGAFDPDLDVFDLIMPLKRGTTYNSYLIIDEKVALVDTVKKGFEDEWLSRIQSIISPEKIDYIILNHFELDHSANLMTILEKAPNAKIVISKNAQLFLKGTFNHDFDNVILVNDGDEISLGKKTIKFFKAPFMHWPDTLFNYLVEDEMIITSDAFGAHVCDKRIFNDLTDDYIHDFEYYYHVIMSPFKSFVLAALDKIKDLKISIICPSHGQILRRDSDLYLKKYRDWSTLPEKTKIKVFIAYASIYGSTRKMAEKIAEGLMDDKIEVELFDTVNDSGKYPNLPYILDQSDCILIGSPTIVSAPIHPVWDFCANLIMINKRKKFSGTFTSFGWNGDSVSVIEGLLNGMHFKLISEGLKVNMVPDKSDQNLCVSWGKQIAEALKNKIKL